MGNSLKVTPTRSSSLTDSTYNEHNNVNFHSQQYLPPPNSFSYYSGWPSYPHLSSYPPSHLSCPPSQTLSYLPTSSYTSDSTSHSSQFTSLPNTLQHNNNNI